MFSSCVYKKYVYFLPFLHLNPLLWLLLVGSRSEFSVAEVWRQQGGLHQGFMSEAEGDLWAGNDAGAGLCKHWVASSWDLQAQRLTRGEDGRVWAAGQRSGGRKEARPRANPDSGAAGWCYIEVAVHPFIPLRLIFCITWEYTGSRRLKVVSFLPSGAHLCRWL